MLEIMKKEYRRHKAFIMAYIAICVFGAFFFGQFMYDTMPVHSLASAESGESLSGADTLLTLNEMVLGDSFKKLAGNYSSVIGISCEPFTGLLFLGIMQNINRFAGHPMNMPEIPVGHPAVLAVVAVCFVASKLMRANSTTKVFGICTLGYLEKFLGTACVIAIGILSVVGVAGSTSAAVVNAASASEIATTAGHYTVGVLTTIFAVVMSIMSLIINYIVRTVMMGLDALESVTPTVVDVIIEVVKTAIVLFVFIINVAYPKIGYAINIIILIICCLIFKACYNAAQYLKKIYIGPFFRGIFGYKEDYPLVRKHIPGRVKRKFKGQLDDIHAVIPLYTIKKPRKWDLKLKLYERVWLVNVGEQTGILFRKYNGERNCFYVLNSTEENPIYLRKGFRFFELYTYRKPVEGKKNIIKSKDMDFVFTREYRYRFEELIALTGLVNVNEEKMTKRQQRKAERKAWAEQTKQNFKEWIGYYFYPKEEPALQKVSADSTPEMNADEIITEAE